MGGREKQLKRKEELRRRILDAACELFATDGYKNTSIRKIAEKIDYSIPTIYFYFKDKADLFDALCEETFSELGREHREIIEFESNPKTALEKCMRSFVQFALEHPHHFLVTFSAEFDHSTDPDFISRRQLIGMHSFDVLRTAVNKYLQSQEKIVTQTEVEEASQIIAASIHGLTSWIIALPNYSMFQNINHESLIEKTISTLLRGIVATSNDS